MYITLRFKGAGTELGYCKRSLKGHITEGGADTEAQHSAEAEHENLSREGKLTPQTCTVHSSPGLSSYMITTTLG